MSGHSNVVAWCKMQVGEKENPPGSNRGEFVQFCQSHTWLKGTGWPWCAAFVVTAISEGAGVGYPCPTASAFGLLADAKKRGWDLPANSSLVVPGDIVVFDIGSGHTGIVTKVTSKQVFSIDGNAGDSVKACVRLRSTVRGFVHWPEDLPPRKRTPFVKTASSASGSRKLTVAGVNIPVPARKDKVT